MSNTNLILSGSISESNFWSKLNEDLEDFHLEEFKPDIINDDLFKSKLKFKCQVSPNESNDLKMEELLPTTTCKKSLAIFCLETLPAAVREKIWRSLPSNQLPKIRLLCKTFQEEIDHRIGTQFIFDESIPKSVIWARSIGISKLIIRKMISPTSSNVSFLKSPSLLQILEIDGPITSHNFQYILSNCPELHTINIRMPFLEILKGSRELFPYSSEKASEFHPACCCNRLKSLKIISILNENRDNFIQATVDPLINNIHYKRFSSLVLWVKCDFPNFQYLMDKLLNLMLSLGEESMMRDLNLNFPVARRLQAKDLSKINESHFIENSHRFRFPKHLKSLELLDLSRLTSNALTSWKMLISKQMNLTVFKSNIGPIFWKFYEPIVKQCSLTLVEVSLRQIKTWDSANQISLPFDLGIFNSCSRLQSLELIGISQLVNCTTTATCYGDIEISTKLENISKLPTNLGTIQLENFKLTPTEVFEFQRSCSALHTFSVQYWNISQVDVETSMNFLEFMLRSKKFQKCAILDWREFAIPGRSAVSAGKFVKRNSTENGDYSNRFLDLIRKVKHFMTGTVTTDNSFAFGIQLLQKPIMSTS